MNAPELELEVAALELQTELGTPELETQRSGQATIHWSGPYSVAQARHAGVGKHGLYVIYRSGRVVDSGKAQDQDLAERLGQHFDHYTRHQTPLAHYRVRLGIVRRKAQINLAEGTVTRSLAKKGWINQSRKDSAGRKLRVPNTAAFRGAGERGVRVIHQGAMPKELRNFTSKRKGASVQTIRRGQRFEYLPPHLLSEAAFEQELDRIADGAGAREGETDASRPWHFWDAWLFPPGGAARLLETVGPVQDTGANAEKLRSTLQLKWQPTARAAGGTLVARCLRWNGTQWVESRF